jgi:hypothetical protein
VEPHDDARRYSRKWFGGIFFGCWGLLIAVKLALAAFGWDRGGVLYWVIVGPLVVGFVGAGVPWLALGARDLLRSRQLVRTEARVWLLPLVAALALVFAVAVVQWLAS